MEKKLRITPKMGEKETWTGFPVSVIPGILAGPVS